MTSMPASRSARAITFAPRSCPSSPGLAMMTRSFLKSKSSNPEILKSSNYGHFLVLAPYVPQRIAHLAERRVSADRLEDRRHRIGAIPGAGAQRIERTRDAAGIARLLDLIDLLELALRRRLVDIENLDRGVIVLDVLVHADDDLFLALDG